MSANLNYAKAKQQARAARAIREHPGDYDQPARSQRPIPGWRTEWDGDPFPVTVTLMQNGKVADLHQTERTAA